MPQEPTSRDCTSQEPTPPEPTAPESTPQGPGPWEPLPEIDEARATRFETLALLDGLDQQQLDYRPAAGKWSAGEIVDHLLKADAFYLRELEELLRRARAGRLPFLFRSVAEIVDLPKPLH